MNDSIDKQVEDAIWDFIGNLNTNPETPTYIMPREDGHNIKAFKQQLLDLINTKVIEARNEGADGVLKIMEWLQTGTYEEQLAKRQQLAELQDKKGKE
jgi:hypothetical protein